MVNNTTTDFTLETKCLDKAKMYLMMSHPFYAQILLTVPFTFAVDPQVPTACTDGWQIRFNPLFVRELKCDYKQVAFVLAHEVEHIARMHINRIREGYHKPDKANIAMDHEVNLSLTEGKVGVMPKGCYHGERYSGMIWEKIYEEMDPYKSQSSSPDGKPDGGSGGESVGGLIGKDLDSSQPLTEKQVEQIKSTIIQSYEACKHFSSIPLGIKRLMENLLKPVVPWQTILQSYLCEYNHPVTDFMKPNKRYSDGGISPGSDNNILSQTRVVLGLDTSGSIDQEMLRRLVTEVMSVHEQVAGGEDEPMTCLWFDTEVYPQELYSGDTPEPKGGGGTSFAPVMNYVKQNELGVKVLIMITDGYAPTGYQDPEIPVVWLMLGEKREYRPKFGDVVFVEDFA